MAVVLHSAGSHNGVFDYLGSLWGWWLDQVALMGGSATARVLSGANAVTRKNTLATWFAAGTAQNDFQGIPSALANWQSQQQSLFSFVQQTSRQIVVDMVGADVSGLLGASFDRCNAELIRQMVGTADSVNASTPAIGSQTAVGSPTGNPVLIGSVKRGDGTSLEYLIAETLTFRVTSDSQQGATSGNEPLSVIGGTAVNGASYLWPQGSGTATSINLVDGSKDNSTNNKLVNSDFVTYTTANNPDNWTILTGSAGVTVLNGTGTGYTTATGNSVEFAGDGATNISIAQKFNTTSTTAVGSGGTPATLLPDTVYAVNLFYKLSAASPAAGILQVDLVNASNSIISDDASTANSATVALTGVGDTNWHSLTAVFRTPAVLPSAVKLRIWLSTALSNTKNVFIARVAFTQMQQLYQPQGPFVAGFSGNTAVVNGLAPDTWTMATTNTFGVIQKMALLFFNMPALQGYTSPQTSVGQQYPSSGAPTVTDSVVA